MQLLSDWLQQRYEFASWREVRATEPGLVGLGFRMTGSELPDWRLHRSRSVQLAGAPPAVLSVWTPAGGGPGLLSVDLHEAPTAEAARAQLLRLLGEFQGPIVERDSSVGDVAFRAGTGAILFARGNYVVQVRSVEREPVAIAPVAERIDQHLQAVPEGSGMGTGPLRAVSTPTGPAPAPGQRVPLDIDVEPTAQGNVWVRIFTRSGRIVIEGGRAWYIAGPAGAQDITISAIDASGSASRTLLRFPKGEGD
jgi:hypothetical protein